MDSRASNVLAVALAILGLVGFVALEGLTAGLSLVVAGLLLLALGLWGWRDRRRPEPALAGSGSLAPERVPVRQPLGHSDEVREPTATEPLRAVITEPRDPVSAPPPDPGEPEAPLAAGVAGSPERTEPDRPAARSQTVADAPTETASTGTADLSTEEVVPGERPSGSGDDPRTGPRPSGGSKPSKPPRARKVPEAPHAPRAPKAARPRPGGARPPAPAKRPTRGPADRSDAPSDAVEAPTLGASHEHDRPIVSHSDLVSHVRDHHPGTATDGSTIQLRLLHEHAHGGRA